MSRQTRRALITIGIVTIPFIIGMLLTYQKVRIRFFTDMADSPAVNYTESPRRLPPVGAISVSAQPLVVGSVPHNPVPADEVSLSRGSQLFGIHCAICHGTSGAGDGVLVEYYTDDPPPEINGSNIAVQADGELYITLSHGFKTMPSMAENLTPRERWDVINYVRALEEE